MTELTIEEKKVGEFLVWRLTGALSVSTMLQLKTRLSERLAKKEYCIAMDLGGVSIIDSTGLGLLSNIKKRLDEYNGHCVYINLSPCVRDGLQQTGLISNLVIVKDEAEFRDSFII